MGNSLQRALGMKLFTHHLGEELHSLHASITIPKAEKPPRSIIHLSCASALLCSGSTTALCSHSSLSCFPSQTRFFIGGHQNQQKTWCSASVNQLKATEHLPEIIYQSYTVALLRERTPRLLQSLSFDY